MRLRLLNHMCKSLRSTTTGSSSSASSSSRVGRTLLSSGPTPRSPTTTQKRKGDRLFSASSLDNNATLRISRAALGVEGCSSALMLLLEGGVKSAEPNLPRGWDAGVDDDGG